MEKLFITLFLLLSLLSLSTFAKASQDEIVYAKYLSHENAIEVLMNYSGGCKDHVWKLEMLSDVCLYTGGSRKASASILPVAGMDDNCEMKTQALLKFPLENYPCEMPGKLYIMGGNNSRITIDLKP